MTRDPAPGDRGAIIAATERLLCERPATDFTVADICAHADVSEDAFRACFADRGEPLLAVFDRLTATIGAEMADAYRSESAWVDGVRSALSALLCSLERLGGLARFLIVDSLTDETLLARRGEVLASLARALEADRPPPARGTPPASFGAAAVVGTAASILHSRLLESARQPLPELHGSLMAVIVLPYLGAGAARGELSRSGLLLAQSDAAPPEDACGEEPCA
ncbi:MAG: TetR/AcrR family transcriptional regulator [Solirubrobacteraceae bacterium]